MLRGDSEPRCSHGKHAAFSVSNGLRIVNACSFVFHVRRCIVLFQHARAHTMLRTLSPVWLAFLLLTLLVVPPLRADDIAGTVQASAPPKEANTPATQTLTEQIALAIKKMAPYLQEKRVMVAAVPHPDNSEDHWPAAPAILKEVIIHLDEAEISVPARVEHMILGVEQLPNQELIDELKEQFEFDLLLAADYRRDDGQLTAGLRLFDAKTRKRLAHHKMDFDGDISRLGYNSNRLVWEYCHKWRGYKIGNGECWTLAASALNDSGCRPAYGYTYGDRVDLDSLLIPGDLIQIEGVSIRGPDGLSISMGHHTAIIHQNLGGGLLQLIHQNGPPLGRYVGLLQVALRSQASGVIMPYRPIMLETADEEN